MIVVLLSLLPLLLLRSVEVGVEPDDIVILDQSNVVRTLPELGDCVLCQNITDRWGPPLLMAADDVMVPGPAYFRARGVANGLDDCGAMSMTVSTIRHKNELNPSSVTLQFMRHNASSQMPGAVFYKKTLQWPSNNYQWQRDYLNRPWDTVFRLQLNELGDDSVTRFNFRDTAFMPPDQVVWFAFYVSLSEHTDQRLRTNTMCWVTLNNESGSMPVRPFTRSTDGTIVKNNDFAFRDFTNFLGQGFTQWTSARSAEQAMQIPPTTNNLAWRVSFECLVDPALVPTEAPITSPPTPEPTEAPTEEAPLYYNDTENSTINDDGGGNKTGSSNGKRIPLQVLWVLLIPASLLLGIAGVTYFVWRRRRKSPYSTRKSSQRKLTVQEPARFNPLQSEDSLFSDFEPIQPPTSSTTLNSIQQQQQRKKSLYLPHNADRTASPIMSPITLNQNNPFARQEHDLLSLDITEDDD